MLDTRRMRLLRELSVHGTVAATAEALHLTGPAVSQQLAALEREAGMPLLEKQGRRLRLTSAGNLLVEHAEVILGGLAAAEADLEALRGGGRGVVRVAAFPSAARVLMPRLWARVGPDVELHLTEREPGPAVEALRQREVNVALVHAYSLLPREVPPGCEQHRLMDDPVFLVLPAGRMEPGETADLGDFAEESWLMPGPETSCHELTKRACGAAGFVPRPVVVASDFSVLTALVAAGAGAALVPRMALPADTTGVGVHPLAQPITRTISVFTRAGESRQPHIRRVLEELQAVSRESRPRR
jgi:DNA-binding transcriptional LysR family regulator